MASRRGKESDRGPLRTSSGDDRTSSSDSSGGASPTRGDSRAQKPDDSDAGGSLGALPEFMRKAFSAGLSGFFLTEEALRKALGETLPKDWSDFAVDQSSRTRAELLERVGFEIGRALENVDVAAVLSQLLEGRTLEVKAEVRLGPREDGNTKPRTRISLRETEEES